MFPASDGTPLQQLDLNNHIEAYRNKRTTELMRALLIFKLCSYGVLVRHQLKVRALLIFKLCSYDVLVKHQLKVRALLIFKLCSYGVLVKHQLKVS